MSKMILQGTAAKRHFTGMKPLFCLVLAVAAAAWGDEAFDRAAIQTVIRQFNDPQTRASVLAPGADIRDLPRGENGDRFLFTLSTIRFVTPDVALADATARMTRPMGIWREHAFFILKREGSDWKIDSLRLLATPGAQILPVLWSRPSACHAGCQAGILLTP